MLLQDCRNFGLPPPTSQLILVPERWAAHACPHGQNGLVLEFETGATDAPKSHVDTSTESARWKGEEETEVSPWWDNLDATKGIGYPARESGRYGSHPSHDGFDDESEP